MSVKILLADDHQIIREGLRSLIEKQPGMEVVAQVENGRTAIKLTRKIKPDVIVMDINMPDMNGIDATRQIVAEFPGIKIIAFSMHSDHQFVAGALKAGVSGYLLKDSAFEELARAIRTVVANQTYLSPKIAVDVVKDYVEKLVDDRTGAPSILTNREREVIQLYAEGHTTKHIAERLYVSIKTVETHRRNIMKKLDIRSIADLTKFAIREGLTSLDT
ncbi:MAG: response regulator transcription factor [Desulfobacterales bacterium]|nr:response regulator transcription factor [Desulfobacteraceae bacterium]MDH3575452.1 response regulator transcription factor [Desulfobacteraceae bacterium]MDH3798302.1 response regulator transcription factor [Desulfobacterales bacterium]MDH3827040.1 response regulator transcription factor [Desulfobacterales bacterium]